MLPSFTINSADPPRFHFVFQMALKQSQTALPSPEVLVYGELKSPSSGLRYQLVWSGPYARGTSCESTVFADARAKQELQQKHNKFILRLNSAILKTRHRIFNYSTGKLVDVSASISHI